MRWKVIFTGIFLVSCVVVVVIINSEFSQSPVFSSSEVSVYDAYVSGSVSASRPKMGSANPISLVLVRDNSSESDMLFDRLVTEYVNTNRSSLVVKTVLSRQDYFSETSDFIYANKIQCDMARLANTSCTNVSSALLFDAWESDTFRIIAPSVGIGIGDSMMFWYRGVPNEDDLESLVRDVEIRVGV